MAANIRRCLLFAFCAEIGGRWSCVSQGPAHCVKMSVKVSPAKHIDAPHGRFTLGRHPPAHDQRPSTKWFRLQVVDPRKTPSFVCYCAIAAKAAATGSCRGLTSQSRTNRERQSCPRSAILAERSRCCDDPRPQLLIASLGHCLTYQRF